MKFKTENRKAITEKQHKSLLKPKKTSERRTVKNNCEINDSKIDYIIEEMEDKMGINNK